MNGDRKRKPQDELQEIARQATREALRNALQGRPFPEEIRQSLVLNASPDYEHEGYYLFWLYIPADRPESAKMVSRARVHEATGEVDVQVFPENFC